MIIPHSNFLVSYEKSYVRIWDFRESDESQFIIKAEEYTMKTSFTIQQVPQTIFGRSEINSLNDEIKQLGASKVLLIIDRTMKEQGITSQIEDLLKKDFKSFSCHVVEESVLTLDSLHQAISSTRPKEFDVIVGYGGWRCTDLAKILGLALSNENAIEKLKSKDQSLNFQAIPVISIPTTPLNGAEIDTKILIRHVQEKVLVEFDHPFLAPRLTIIDPDLMLTLPSDLTASTGIDAISHAIEALISLESSPFSEILAIQSLALLSENLIDAFRNGNNIRARYNVAFGSLLSALALNMTGSGAIHALAYPLTALHGISHAQASALMSLHIVRFNIPVVPDQFVRIARLLGSSVQGNESEAHFAVDALERLIHHVDNPIHLSSYNIHGSDLHELSNLAFGYTQCLVRNPRMIDKEQILDIYRKAF